jgi:predicted O-methyltransferase YrrM
MRNRNEGQANSSVKTYLSLTFPGDLTVSEIENLRNSTGALRALQLPASVKNTLDRAQEWGFAKSSRPEVGLLLSVLAAAVPPRGRVLEIGTGAGVGLTWIVHGLGQRDDVEVISVDLDPDRAASVRAFGWPDWVSVVAGDGAKILRSSPASFDLIFPDSPGGEIYDIGPSIAALRPGGILLLDDMEILKEYGPERRARLGEVARQLSHAPNIVYVDLPLPNGVLLAARRRVEVGPILGRVD